jgi:3'-phosphoadenosine 5'-phosphosulfate sulfotransferase (PAPS reductase)/FAD synthetase
MVVAEHWDKSGPKVRILNCLGLRAEESPARAKRRPFRYDAVASNLTKRHVDEWLRLHDWTEDQVWASISRSGVPHHPAYDLGMSRLSCVFCIFAPRHALLIAAHHNPGLLTEYVAVEQRIGHTFRIDQTLVEIQTAAAANAPLPSGPIHWAQCA